MAEIRDQAWVAVRVNIPPDMTALEAAEEVRKSVSFGSPVAFLMGQLRLKKPVADGARPELEWIPENWDFLLRASQVHEQD